MTPAPFPWFRYYSETSDDPKFRKAARETGLSKAELIGAWSIILCLASKSPVRGGLYVTFQERFSNGDVTDELGVSSEKCEIILNIFIRLGMIEIREDGAYWVKNFDKRQFSSDLSTERVKKHRESQKNTSGNGNETFPKRPGNVSETPPEAEADTESEEEEEEEGATSSTSDWENALFPTNPREANEHPALMAFTKACNRMPGVRDYGTVIDTMVFLRKRFSSDDELIDYLGPFWFAWSTRRRANGQKYNASSIAWLTEWAVNNEIPQSSNGNGKRDASEMLEGL